MLNRHMSELTEGTIVYGIDGEYEALKFQHLNKEVYDLIVQYQEKAKKLDEIKKGVKKMEDYQKAVTKETKDYPYIDIRNIVKELNAILKQ